MSTLTLGKLTSLVNSFTNADQQIQKVVNIRHDTEAPFYKLHFVSLQVPEELSNGVFIFHNPNAKNRFPKGFLNQTNGIHFHMTAKGYSTIGENAPIVARLNMPTMMFPDQLADEMYLKFNS